MKTVFCILAALCISVFSACVPEKKTETPELPSEEQTEGEIVDDGTEDGKEIELPVDKFD